MSPYYYPQAFSYQIGVQGSQRQQGLEGLACFSPDSPRRSPGQASTAGSLPVAGTTCISSFGFSAAPLLTCCPQLLDSLLHFVLIIWQKRKLPWRTKWLSSTPEKGGNGFFLLWQTWVPGRWDSHLPKAFSAVSECYLGAAGNPAPDEWYITTETFWKY